MPNNLTPATNLLIQIFSFNASSTYFLLICAHCLGVMDLSGTLPNSTIAQPRDPPTGELDIFQGGENSRKIYSATTKFDKAIITTAPVICRQTLYVLDMEKEESIVFLPY